MRVSSKGALLDTNILIMLFAGDPRVSSLLKSYAELLVPVPALGELYHGAQNSSRVTENTQRIDRLASEIDILDCDIETSRTFGTIKHQLRKKGRPIPVNDMWIAALANQHALTIVTRDRHFREITGLKVDFLS